MLMALLPSTPMKRLMYNTRAGKDPCSYFVCGYERQRPSFDTPGSVDKKINKFDVQKIIKKILKKFLTNTYSRAIIKI